MNKKQLRSIGISDTEAEILLKVRNTMNGRPTNDIQEIYRICANSGNFTDEELEILKSVKKEDSPSIIEMVIRIIKKILKK